MILSASSAAKPHNLAQPRWPAHHAKQFNASSTTDERHEPSIHGFNALVSKATAVR
jgi:hypothetical protein